MKRSQQMFLVWILLLLTTGLFAGVTVVSETDNELVVDFTLDNYDVSREGDFTRIQTQSMVHPGDAGQPDLPYFTRRIAVPPGGSIRFSTDARKAIVQHLDAPLIPIPKIYQEDANEVSRQSYEIDTEAYEEEAHPMVEIVHNGHFRGIQTVTVRVNPFSYNHDNKTLSIQQSIRVRFTYEGNRSKSSRLSKPSPALQSVVLNPSQAAGWKTSDRDEIEYADFAAYPIWLRIEVKKDGIFKIPASTINNLYDIGMIDPTELRLFGTGGEVMDPGYNFDGLKFAEIPIFVEGESDHSFDSSDYILFYGSDRDDYEINVKIEPNHYYNPYSQAGVYWLTFGEGDTNPARITSTSLDGSTDSRSNAFTTMHYEEESIRREDDGFDWYSKQLGYQGSAVTDYNYSFDISDIDPTEDQTFRIAVRELSVAGVNDNRHQITILLNGTTVLNNSWNGPYYRTFYGSGSFAQNGSNALTVRLTRTSSTNILLDYYELEYFKKLIKRSGQFRIDIADTDIGDNIEYTFSSDYNSNLKAFEVDDFDDVKLRPISSVSGGFSFIGNGNSSTRIYVTSSDDYYSADTVELYNPVDLTNTPSRQVVIITPDVFLDGAVELKNIYQEFYGYNTQIAKLQDVFNQFSGGMPDPAGIKMFLENACQNDPDALTYVVLLGAGVYDWRNFSDSSIPKNRLIAYQISSTTSDDFFVYFTDDDYPEMAIGRYPAQTVDDLELMIGRVRAYLENPTAGFWKNTVMIVADDQYNSGSINQVEHTNNAQTNSEQVSPAIYVEKVMAIEYELDAFNAKPDVRDYVVEKLNEGVLVFYYTGHGATHVLGDEKYFSISDLPLLDNADKLPLFIAASCSVGKFDTYETNCLAEEVLFAENGGAIASLAATCETTGGNNTGLMGILLEQMCNNREPLGLALMNAKNIYHNQSSGSTGNSERYVLMGDPVMMLVPPAREENMVIEDRPDSLFALQTINVEGDYNFVGSDIYDGSTTMLRVYDAETEYKYYATDTAVATWTELSSPLFRGEASVENGNYDATFIVPYDIAGGTTGRMIAMTENGDDSRISFLYPISLSTQAVYIENDDAPSIEMWLDSKDFEEEDTVTSDPILIADISDSTGVNILGKPGHKILTRIDEETTFTDVTEGFSYNLDSHTTGELSWQLSGIPKGDHTLELIAFDNANEPSVQHIDFKVSTDSDTGTDIGLTDILPYPNPYEGKEDFYFTFVISQNADSSTNYNVKISVYTITGRKIQTIERMGCRRGYNQIRWNVRDADGDKIANNTYIYKIKVTEPVSGKSKEKTGKMIVYQ